MQMSKDTSSWSGQLTSLHKENVWYLLLCLRCADGLQHVGAAKMWPFVRLWIRKRFYQTVAAATPSGRCTADTPPPPLRIAIVRSQRRNSHREKSTELRLFTLRRLADAAHPDRELASKALQKAPLRDTKCFNLNLWASPGAAWQMLPNQTANQQATPRRDA